MIDGTRKLIARFVIPVFYMTVYIYFVTFKMINNEMDLVLGQPMKTFSSRIFRLNNLEFGELVFLEGGYCS